MILLRFPREIEIMPDFQSLAWAILTSTHDSRTHVSNSKISAWKLGSWINIGGISPPNLLFWRSSIRTVGLYWGGPMSRQHQYRGPHTKRNFCVIEIICVTSLLSRVVRSSSSLVTWMCLGCPSTEKLIGIFSQCLKNHSRKSHLSTSQYLFQSKNVWIFTLKMSETLLVYP